MRKVISTLSIAAMLFSCAAARAQQNARTGKPSTDAHTAAAAQVKPESALDRERFEFEKRKYQSDLDLENRKLDIEREKLHESKSSSRLSEFTTVIPLFLTLATLCFSVWSFQRQARQQAAAQLETARLQFDLKAAEIVFSAKSPEAAANKARSLITMFPERLPASFAQGFDPKDVGGGKEDPEGKKLFLELLLKYPGNDDKLFDLWAEVFGDDWLDRVKPVLTKHSPVQPTQAGKAAAPGQTTATGPTTSP